MLFPSADDFHDNVDADRNARFRDEYGGITNFPFPSTELNLLAIHPRLIELAEALLETGQLRVDSIEAWRNHRRGELRAVAPSGLSQPLVTGSRSRPTRATGRSVRLSLRRAARVGAAAPRPSQSTGPMPAIPNWYPRSDGCSDPQHPAWISTTGRPDLYDVEVGASGAAGTVVAYRIETFHRGTALVLPRGAAARFTSASAPLTPIGSPDAGGPTPQIEGTGSTSCVPRPPRQLELFGFPPPGHPYWTDETMTGMAQRYPGLDLALWRR